MKSHEFLTEDDDSSKTQPYKIQRGDTLTKIADAHGTTVDAIMALNKNKISDQNKIYANDVIKIPADVVVPGGPTKRKAADTITPDPAAKSKNTGSDAGSKDKSDSSTAVHPVGTVVKPDWSTTPYRDLGALIKKPDGSWYTLDGKNHATDEKVIAMAERLPPVSMPNDNMGGDNFGITDKGWDGAKSSGKKLPIRPGQNQSGKTDDRSSYTPPDKQDISPIAGDTWITDGFGTPRPGRPLGHQGVDLHAAIGTEVLAPNNAKVLTVDHSKSQGNFVILGDDRGTPTHQFMHLDTVLAKPGDNVQKGDVIAKSGNTGTRERYDKITGTNKIVAVDPHLHWTKYVNGTPVNPSDYLKLQSKPR